MFSTESNQLFNKAKDIIETLLQSKKDLVGSSVWGVDFKVQCVRRNLCTELLTSHGGLAK